MQIRQSTFESGHFRCPFDHEEAGPCLLRHGAYQRYASSRGTDKISIPRLLCKFTGMTLSILPDTMLPYWSLPVPELDEHFQQQSTAPAESAATCEQAQRAWKRFASAERMQSLRQFFGQRLPLANSPTVIWRAIKHTGGSLKQILRELAEAGKSLLGDYRCLSP